MPANVIPRQHADSGTGCTGCVVATTVLRTGADAAAIATSAGSAVTAWRPGTDRAATASAVSASVASAVGIRANTSATSAIAPFTIATGLPGNANIVVAAEAVEVADRKIRS